MKNVFNGLCVALLGVVLASGCGGAAPEPGQDAPPATAGNDSPAPGQEEAPMDDSQLPGAELAEPGSVSGLTACCFARCSDGKWHGPFKTITYGNCGNYSKYWCANHKWKYVSAKWDEC